MKKIAYFITSHGFGHATRSIAVINAVLKLNPNIHFEIFTKVPLWFFNAEINSESFTYHELLTDIGLIQKDSLNENISETIDILDNFLPFDRLVVENTAKKIKALDCKLVISDISPLGIEIAENAKIPSVLIENFTWDWIYNGYIKYNTKFSNYSKYLNKIFNKAHYHIQTEPVCNYVNANLISNPVSRYIKDSRKIFCDKLKIPQDAKVITISISGVKKKYPFIDKLKQHKNYYFILTGSRNTLLDENVLSISTNADIYHPDLINASDLVIGKVGYSTLCEVFNANVCFWYIGRKDFCESKILIEFIEKHMCGQKIDESEFYNGVWLPKLKDFDFKNKPSFLSPNINGADQIARFVLENIC